MLPPYICLYITQHFMCSVQLKILFKCTTEDTVYMFCSIYDTTHHLYNSGRRNQIIYSSRIMGQVSMARTLSMYNIQAMLHIRSMMYNCMFNWFTLINCFQSTLIHRIKHPKKLHNEAN